MPHPVSNQIVPASPALPAAGPASGGRAGAAQYQAAAAAEKVPPMRQDDKRNAVQGVDKASDFRGVALESLDADSANAMVREFQTPLKIPKGPPATTLQLALAQGKANLIGHAPQIVNRSSLPPPVQYDLLLQVNARAPELCVAALKEDPRIAPAQQSAVYRWARGIAGLMADGRMEEAPQAKASWLGLAGAFKKAHLPEHAAAFIAGLQDGAKSNIFQSDCIDKALNGERMDKWIKSLAHKKSDPAPWTKSLSNPAARPLV
jgi:hypothetical protein